MRVAIVGAGFAGLTTARHLRDFGHEVTVFEKAPDVGGVWSRTRHYPGVSTQNGKDTYCFSDFPMPANYPEWPSGQQVQAYLHAYAERFGLLPLLRLSTQVKAAEQDENGRWTLTIAPEDAGEQRERFDVLAVCNGIFSTPAVPEYPGAAEFRAAGGTLCHSSDFPEASDAKGKHVLVVGYGKSSCDVAVAVSDAAASTTVVARELIWKLPKRLMGRLNYKYLFLTRMGEALIPYQGLRGFERFLHGPGRRVRNSMLGSVQSVITKQLRLRELGALPPGSFERIARSTVSLVTDGFFERLDGGTIRLKRDNAITRLLVKDGKPVAELRSGEQVPADVVICGTGWTQDVPFLDPATKARILDDGGNFRLYRCILPPKVPNLVFNGYNSSFFSPLSAEMGALWIAAYLGGALRLPSVQQQLAVTDRRLRWMEERTEGKHARGTNIIPFTMHQIDELLSDMGLSVGPLQRFLEWQLPVRPGRYARFAHALHRRMKPRAKSPELMALPAE